MINMDTGTMFLEAERQILAIEELAFNLPKPVVVAEDGEEGLEPDLEQIVQDSDVLLSVITEQNRSKRMWQIAAVFLMTCVAVVSIICAGFYAERADHIERISQVEATVQKAAVFEKQLAESDQEVAWIQKELAGSRAELKSAQDELKNSKAELKRAQEDLKNSKSEIAKLQREAADTTQQLKMLKERNAEAVKQLSERLRKLSD